MADAPKLRGTKEALVRDLMKLPPSPARDKIAFRAAGNAYHDFLSPHAMPKHLLVKDLLAAGFTTLAVAAKRGAYDDDPPGRVRRG